MSDLSEIMAQLERLPPEDRARLEAEVIAATEQLRFIPNPGKQTQAMLNPADVILYGGSGGSGKAQSLHCKVLTPFGFKAIGDLKVGDIITDVRGMPQTVTGVYPQGVKEVYNIYSEGGVTQACADHLWSVVFKDPSGHGYVGPSIMTTLELRHLLRARNFCERPDIFIPKLVGNYSFLDGSLVSVRGWDNDFSSSAPVACSYTRNITAIHKCRKKQECVCISVSGHKNLYITDDLIVTHNTSLGVGLAFNDHRRSLLLRRKYADLNGLIDQALVYNKGRNGFSSAPQPKLITDDGRLLKFGACQHLGDEEAFQGQAHDYYYFDELTHFLEQQFRYIIGWNRAGPGVDSSQRCRVLCGSNPPTSSDGDWVIGYWRPWLDPTYHKPAKSGEIRWAVTDPDGKDMWVDGPEPFDMAGKLVKPKSRTFIQATLSDNPYLINTDYAATLDSLPEPLRSALRDGNFMLSRADSDNQLIPTRWIQAAQARWVAAYKQGKQMTALGVDVADGGGDDNVAAPWYDYFLDELKVVNGKDAPESSDVASFVVKHRRNGCPVGMDMGGGYGGAPKLILNDSGIDVTPFKGALGTEKLDRSGQLGFTNLISYAYWLFREALDPDQDGGSKVMLPMDQGLLSDLSAPTYETIHYKGKLCVRKESKDSIKKRIGRSPDKGDAVVIGYWLNVRRMKELQRNGGLGARPIKVNLSHTNKRRK